jgi:hypothetical protein
MVSAILPTADIRQGERRSNFTTVAIPACVTRLVTGIVDPSVTGPNDPSASATSSSTTAWGQDALGRAGLGDLVFGCAQRIGQRGADQRLEAHVRITRHARHPAAALADEFVQYREPFLELVDVGLARRGDKLPEKALGSLHRRPSFASAMTWSTYACSSVS